MSSENSTLPLEPVGVNPIIAQTLKQLASDFPAPVGADLSAAIVSPNAVLATDGVRSKSYVVIVCGNTTTPDCNQIQIRNSTICVKLKSGINILTVEQFPELKYGFFPKQIRKNVMCPNENCQSIIEIDLSHFDTSEVESTEMMFEDMFALRKVNLSNVRFCKVQNMNNMFARCISLRDITINSILTFKSNMLTTATGMFYWAASIKSLGLAYFGGNKLKTIVGMFASMDSLEKLDLSGWNVRGIKIGTDEEHLFEGCKKLDTIYMIGSEEYSLQKIYQEFIDSDYTPRKLFIKKVFLVGAK